MDKNVVVVLNGGPEPVVVATSIESAVDYLVKEYITLDMSVYSYELHGCITIKEAMEREEIEDCAEFLTYYAYDRLENLYDLWLYFFYKKLYT